MVRKKVPLRMCIVCGEMKDKKTLTRIVHAEDGIFVDRSGRRNGRGAYICDNPNCAASLRKKRALDRAFSCKVDDTVYEEIRKELLE